MRTRTLGLVGFLMLMLENDEGLAEFVARVELEFHADEFRGDI